MESVEPYYLARMTHEFHENCSLLKQLAPLFIVFSLVYAGAFAAWAFICWKRKDQIYAVQRFLALLPAMLSLQVLLQGLDYKTCPWVNADMADQAYLKMGKVCTVTFSYTFIHAIFYVLCRGWSITDQQVDRNQATNLTTVMGIIYLIYSAYFLSADFQSWIKVVNVFVAIVYLVLGIVNIRNLSE